MSCHKQFHELPSEQRSTREVCPEQREGPHAPLPSPSGSPQPMWRGHSCPRANTQTAPAGITQNGRAPENLSSGAKRKTYSHFADTSPDDGATVKERPFRPAEAVEISVGFSPSDRTGRALSSLVPLIRRKVSALERPPQPARVAWTLLSACQHANRCRQDHGSVRNGLSTPPRTLTQRSSLRSRDSSSRIA